MSCRLPLHVVYDSRYNVPAMGSVAEKFGAVLEQLSALQDPTTRGSKGEELPLHVHPPSEAFDVAASHDPDYIAALEDPTVLREVFEMDALEPDVAAAILEAQRLQYCGSLTAADLALQHGFAVNLGGGLHHASRRKGSGFCVYNDITAVVDYLLETGKAKRILIVDLDAHQGNGYEEDLWEHCQGGRVCIFDAYEPMIFPFPAGEAVKQSIHYYIPYLKDDRGDTFIDCLLKGIGLPFDEFQPDFVIYNAGTDTLEGDPVTRLGQTAEAIADRDYIVVETCRRAGVPVMMCMSGGYGEAVPRVVAESLWGLLERRPDVIEILEDEEEALES